jgi:hypothetical protein
MAEQTFYMRLAVVRFHHWVPIKFLLTRGVNAALLPLKEPGEGSSPSASTNMDPWC